MDKSSIEYYVKKYLNDETADKIPQMQMPATALEIFQYNTAKRLIVSYDKYKIGKAGKDVYLCSLRNYLLVFQNDIAITADGILSENEYGIMKNASGQYYASLELPEYINWDFVNQAFQRNVSKQENTKTDDVFYGTNAFIYGLTGYKSFKSLSQKLAVFGALATPGGYTTLVSLPTGGGKSLITQTMAYQNEGLTIVVVPTVSLAMDQVRTAKNNIKHETDSEIFCYYSGIKTEQRDALRNAIKQETARLLFISPEALIRNFDFENIVKDANSKKYLKNLIIDEAHIVIEWGDFFRVDYQCLEAWRDELIVSNAQLRTILLSATYTTNTVINLKQMFAISSKWIEVRCDALRHEPRFILVKASNYTDKRSKMIELIKKLPHPMVIYVNSPMEAESIREILVAEGINSLETFTGSTKSAERKRIINDWSEDKIDLIIATAAFGVGVDKGDVRTVVHLYIPDTPNQYYQELGRGGRDGLISLSVMCINPDADIRSAYNRMNKVLRPDKIWGRWLSMYKSPTCRWFRGLVTLDTAVKPTYNATAEDNDASDIDIQWNVYVILLLRRYNLLTINSMKYDPVNEHYKIQVKIRDDILRIDESQIPQLILDIRDEESKKFENEIKRIRRAIDYNGKLCWSEMFYSTFDKVSMYCGGCAKHQKSEMMEVERFPLLLSVKEPAKTISADLYKLCQGEKEVLLIGETDDYSLVNRYLNAGVCIIVVNDTGIDNNFDLFLNMNKCSSIMIVGIKEYRELCKLAAGYYISGGVIALYNSDESNYYEFCSILKKYQKDNMRIIHIMKDDIFVQKLQKPLSAMIDGPKIEGYILERM